MSRFLAAECPTNAEEAQCETLLNVDVRIPASSASFALRRSYIAIKRSSFSTSARGSSAILSINVKTVEGLSDGGAGSSRSTGRSPSRSG